MSVTLRVLRRVADAVGAPAPHAATLTDNGTWRTWHQQATLAAGGGGPTPDISDKAGMEKAVRDLRRLAGD